MADNKIPENDESTAVTNDGTETQKNQINIQLEGNDSSEKEDNFEIKKEEFDKKIKKSPLKKILIILVGFLVSLILIGLILYFIGFFEPKEEPLKTEQTPVVSQEVATVEEYKFNLNDINSKKLNEQLAYLTNKNLNEEKQEELERIENEKKLIEDEKKREEEALKAHEDSLLKEQKALEEKKAELEREKAELEILKQEALRIKEELQSNQNSVNTMENIDNNPTEEPIKEELQTSTESTDNNTQKSDGFLKFINVAKIKGVLYKKYLDSVVAVNANVILCRDDKNRIELYYGPFNTENERTELLKKLIENGFEQAYELEFTQEEFNNRCNY